MVGIEIQNGYDDVYAVSPEFERVPEVKEYTVINVRVQSAKGSIIYLHVGGNCLHTVTVN